MTTDEIMALADKVEFAFLAVGVSSQIGSKEATDECVTDARRSTDELRRLREENEALRADAERYRWLRDMASQDWIHHNHNYRSLRGAAFDAAIDAARKGE